MGLKQHGALWLSPHKGHDPQKKIFLFAHRADVLSSLIVHKSTLSAKRPQKIVKWFSDFQHHAVGQSNEAGIALSACRLDMHYVCGIDCDIDGAINLDTINTADCSQQLHLFSSR